MSSRRAKNMMGSKDTNPSQTSSRKVLSSSMTYRERKTAMSSRPRPIAVHAPSQSSTMTRNARCSTQQRQRKDTIYLNDFTDDLNKISNSRIDSSKMQFYRTIGFQNPGPQKYQASESQK